MDGAVVLISKISPLSRVRAPAKKKKMELNILIIRTVEIELGLKKALLY